MALMIVPTWPSQPWYPRLLDCLIDYPIILPYCQDLLRQAHNGQKHPLNLRKVACVVSGIPSKREEFQNQLEISSLNHAESLPQDNTRILGGNGVFGVIHKRLIPFHQMKFKLINNLAKLYVDGKSYSCINTHKCSICQTLSCICLIKVLLLHLILNRKQTDNTKCL